MNTRKLVDTFKYIFVLAVITVMCNLFFIKAKAVSITGTTGTGTEDDPIIVDTFTELKTALEADEELYIKCNGFTYGLAGYYPLVPDVDYTSMSPAINSKNTKHLTMNGDIDCRANDSSASLYSFIYNAGNLTIDGEGTISVSFNASGCPNSIVFNGDYASNLTIKGNVTFNATQNAYQTFGRSIYNYAGIMNIYSGTFIGDNKRSTDGESDAVLIGKFSRDNEIYGGAFYSTNSNTSSTKSGLAIDEFGTYTSVSLYGGVYNGIDSSKNIGGLLPENYFTKNKTTGVAIDLSATKTTSEIIKVCNKYAIDGFNMSVTAPKNGDTFSEPVLSTTGCTLSSAEWYLINGADPMSGSKLASGDKFLPGKTYRLQVIVLADEGYHFENDTENYCNTTLATNYYTGASFVNCYFLFTTPSVEIETIEVEVKDTVGYKKLSTPVCKTEGLTLSDYSWTLIRDGQADLEMGKNDDFRDGFKYKLHVIVVADTGYTIKADPVMNINGVKATNYNCGDTYANCFTYITASAHTCSNTYHAKVDATCTTNGNVAYYECKMCGKKYSDEAGTKPLVSIIIPASHTYGDLLMEVPATCIATGTAAHYECSACHKLFNSSMVEKTQEELGIAVDSNAHSYGSIIEEVPATCAATGTAAHYECSACHKLFNSSKVEKSAEELEIAIDSNAHSYGSITEEIPATCVAIGTKAHKDCSLCGKHFDSSNVEIADLTIPTNDNHDLESEWTGVINGHYHVCKNIGCPAGHDGLVAHTPDRPAATEEYPIKCTVCDYIISPVLGHTHSLTLVPEVSKTCSVDGTKAYYTCSGCSSKFEDELGANEITDINWYTISAGHTFGEWIDEVEATYTASGTKGHKDCSVCNKHFDATNNEIADLVIEQLVCTHDTLTKINEVAATNDSYGVKAYYSCNECGKYFEDEAKTKEIADLNNWKANDGQIAKLQDTTTPTTPETPTTPDTPTTPETQKKGLFGGAIAGIVIGTVVLASIGGFSLFWFVIKKKNFADLVKVFKK